MKHLSARKALRRPFRFPAARAFAIGIAACALAAPALGQAQDDRMTPIAAPAQPDAIELGTGALPGATAKESWHRQYGSRFARNVTVATLPPFLPDPAKASGAAVVVDGIKEAVEWILEQEQLTSQEEGESSSGKRKR